MKDYIIWLKGGNCLEGTAKDEILSKFKKGYYDFKDKANETQSICNFPDDEGVLTIDFAEVQAFAINKHNANKQSGFKGDGE